MELLLFKILTALNLNSFQAILLTVLLWYGILWFVRSQRTAPRRVSIIVGTVSIEQKENE